MSIEEKEKHRIRTIAALGLDFDKNKEADRAINENWSVERFRTEILEGVPIPNRSPEIGLTKNETNQFSIVKGIRSLADHGDFRDAGFEGEVSRAVQQHFRREPRDPCTLSIPFEIMRSAPGKRDMQVGVDPQGGYFVQTDVLTGSFIEILRNRSMVGRLGATRLTGLIGNLAIPEQTGGATAYWLGEGAAPTETEQTIGQVNMTPKTVGALTEYTRKLMLQTSLDVEAFIRQDLASLVAVEIDRVAINGSGAGEEPLGIRNTTGINSVIAGDPDGANPTWDDIVDLESEIAIDNADFGRLGYLTNSKVRGYLKKTLKSAGIAGYIWEGSQNIRDAQEGGLGVLNGYRAGVSNNVPSNLTKGASVGILSSIIFGNWADLLIGEWGTLDIMVNPFVKRKNAIIEVSVFQDIDLAIRHRESFAVMDDVLTT